MLLPNQTEADATRGERHALGWAAIAAAAAIVWIVIPVGVGILFGTLLALALPLENTPTVPGTPEQVAELRANRPS